MATIVNAINANRIILTRVTGIFLVSEDDDGNICGAIAGSNNPSVYDINQRHLIANWFLADGLNIDEQNHLLEQFQEEGVKRGAEYFVVQTFGDDSGSGEGVFDGFGVMETRFVKSLVAKESAGFNEA